MKKNNIKYIWDYNNWEKIFWYYCATLRKWDIKYLSDKISFMKTKDITKTLEENIEYWKERFYKPRLERLRQEWKMPVYNRLDYSLQNKI